MRSTTSSNDIKTIVRDNFKKFWTVPAFGLFWLLIWGLVPVMLLSSADDIIEITHFTYNVNIGYPIFVLLMPIVCGLTVFSYLQNPSASNHMHSLPLSRSKLFWANVLSGLLMIAAPIIANGIIMSIYAACTGNPMFFKWMIVTFICSAAVFAITAFAAMISGNTLMHLFNACFFNGVLALILIVFIILCDTMLTGYETSDGLMMFTRYSNAFTASIGRGSRLLICIVYLAVTAVALLVAWAIYKKRPIERTGESLIFSWTRGLLFLICVFSGALLIGLFIVTIMSGDSIARLDHIMIIGMLIGGVATFVIGSILIDRSSKIFTKQNLLPAAIALALAFVVSGAVNADVLGYSKYVPEVKDVKSVCVDVQNTALLSAYDDEGNSATYFPGYADYYENVAEVKAINGLYPCFSSEESIGAIIDLQESMIDQKTEDMECTESIRFIYELNNGKTVKRAFDLYEPLEGVNNGTLSKIDPEILEAVSRLYDSKEFKTIYSLNNLKPDYFEEGAVTYYADLSGDDNDYYAISSKDAIELKAAMEKDFQKLTYDKAMHYGGDVNISRKVDPNMEDMDTEESLTEVLDLTIPKEAKNTRTWLKDHNFKVK